MANYYSSSRTGASYLLDSFNSWLGGTNSVRFNFGNFRNVAIRFDKTLPTAPKGSLKVKLYVVRRHKVNNKGKYIITQNGVVVNDKKRKNSLLLRRGLK